MNRNFKSKSGLTPRFKSPLTRPFKSPASTGKPYPSQAPKAAEKPEEKIEELKKRLASVRSQISDLEGLGYKEEELQEHIDKLHEYNEVKDAASIVLGRIAVFERVQTKDLYQRYGLELTD